MDVVLTRGLLAGANVMGYLVAGLLFFRFWSRTRDRLFFIFAWSFVLLGVHRILLALNAGSDEDQVPFYLLRLLAYALILLALYDKNRVIRRADTSPDSTL